jgi:hypothetical protein
MTGRDGACARDEVDADSDAGRGEALAVAVAAAARWIMAISASSF